MGCNVVELSYIRPKRGIFESDGILAKDRWQKNVAGWAPSRDGLFRLSELLDEDFALMLHPLGGRLDVIFLRGLLE